MQMLAPVCPLLVEEAWDYTPEALKNNSVHPARTIWTPLPRADPQTEAFLTETQNYIDRINTAVKAAQERVRADKKLGSSLESAVAIHSGSGEPCQWFSSHFSKALTGTDAQAFPEGLSPAQRDELAGLFVVSGVRMGWTPETMIEGGGYSEEEAFVANEEKGWSGSVVVHQALAEKCPRCWRYQKEEDNELCGRCEEVTKEET
jgi:isoleucyl-tRNA synthetase